MKNSSSVDVSFTELIKSLMQTDPAAAAACIKEYLEKKNNTPLNIAITGESGAGKSTFINYFREMTNNDEGAAPTGCTETTFESSPYPHPKYPNVVLWDLPGIGTTTFPADEYLKKMGFEKFDFFIIISDTRFRENDVKLAKAIQKMEKKFYFVRSKIDSDLQNEKRGKNNFNEEETLKKIREYCIQGLQKEGFESPQVFLISNFDLHLYDFPLLHETLDRELPEHKRRALLMAMPNINLEVINKKKESLQSLIKYYAAASAAGAAVPVPGLSIAVDSALIVQAVTTFVVSFGLDVKSLDKLADGTGVAATDLIKEILSPLAAVEITPTLILNFLGQLGSVVGLMAGEEVSRFIPVFGTFIAMGLSFAVTYKSLNHILDKLAEDAQRVFKRALGLNSSV
ncbi:interferon-inducible GTPase 5-like [Nematolebias whitei]|uniref:interferon-inducible GTPase 5-like n=1 Tax=Nematolebias whitei TaxID=451745 RepID=UPI00189B63EF|nr:interferon-inducible GTPase 5-like [Nematolebias whitei]